MASQPIPLSIPAEKEELESIDALLNSIRHLVSCPDGEPEDIVDLRRPIHEQNRHEPSGHISPHHESSQQPIWDLSEKTVSQSTQALSSFVRTLNNPQSPLPNPAPQDGTIAADSIPAMPSGVVLEDLVAQCLKAPLDRWVRDHTQSISSMVQHQVNQKVLALLRLWMDENLPKLLQESINKQLECLVERAKKNQH